MSELDSSKLGVLGKKARNTAITLMKWAKSCETPEQFETFKKFYHKYSWETNQLENTEVQYYMGVCTGFVIALDRTKFA